MRFGAAYDSPNILTYFVGIPTIVLPVSTLLARPVLGHRPLGAWGPLARSPSLHDFLLSLLRDVFCDVQRRAGGVR